MAKQVSPRDIRPFSETGWQADEFAAKLSNKKFRVCGFWKGPVQNIAITGPAPEVMLCDVISQVKFAHVVKVRNRKQAYAAPFARPDLNARKQASPTFRVAHTRDAPHGFDQRLIELGQRPGDTPALPMPGMEETPPEPNPGNSGTSGMPVPGTVVTAVAPGQTPESLAATQGAQGQAGPAPVRFWPSATCANCGVSITSTFSRVLPLTTGRSQIPARSAQESPCQLEGVGENMM